MHNPSNIFSKHAEQSVLGGLIMKNDAFELVCHKLVEQDFYFVEHQLIYRVITELFNSNTPFDLLTITDLINKKSQGISIAEPYIYELGASISTAANIGFYADIVKKYSVLRVLRQKSIEIFELTKNESDLSVEEIINEAEAKVFSIADNYKTTSSEPVRLSLITQRTIEHLEKIGHKENGLLGTSTGFKDLDLITMGLQPGDLFLLAARPSMGKTALAVNIAEHVAMKEDKAVLFFSLEMSSVQLMLRIISSTTGLNSKKIRQGALDVSDWSTIGESMPYFNNSNLFIDETSAITPFQIRSRARRIAREHKNLGLIVIDYIQLMHSAKKHQNRTLEIGDISRSLKILAKELNVTVIALSQLNRTLENRSDKRPILADLRDSGCLEQDADIVAFIYREEMYKNTGVNKNATEIIIAKHRNGETGRVRLEFQGRYSRFKDFEDLQEGAS